MILLFFAVNGDLTQGRKVGSGWVDQLVERLLPIPEVRGSNFFLFICLLSTVYWKDKNKEKEAGYGPFKKTTIHLDLGNVKGTY